MNFTAQKLDFLKRLHEENKLPAENLESILSYVRYRRNEGWADETTTIDLKGIVELSKAFDKPFQELTQDDLYNFFDSLSAHLAVSSINLYKTKLKLFFKFIKRGDLAELCIAKQRRSGNKLPDDLLTLEDIEKLINAANSLRDKAFISLLYESGARRGEILNIQLKHLHFDEDGAIVTLPKGKTGARRIRVVFSVGYLRNWVDNHPDKTNRDAPVWASLKYKTKALAYFTAQDNLKRYAEAAGIQKAVNMHSFRHAAATHLAKSLTEQQLKIYLGWTAGSSMAATYVHLSGKDVDEAILKMNGRKIEEKKQTNILKTVNCPRCKEMQDAKSTYCFRCGMPLTSQAQKEEHNTEDIMKKILLDPEIMSLIVQQLQKQK